MVKFSMNRRLFNIFWFQFFIVFFSQFFTHISNCNFKFSCGKSIYFLPYQKKKEEACEEATVPSGYNVSANAS